MKKTLKRRLHLCRETLRQLSDRQVREAHGRDHELTNTCAPSISMPGCICLNTNVSCDC